MINPPPPPCRGAKGAGRVHFRARREQPDIFQGLLPERQGRNLALTVLHVPHSLDRGGMGIQYVSAHPGWSSLRHNQIHYAIIGYYGITEFAMP